MKQIPGITLNQEPLDNETLKLIKDRQISNPKDFNECNSYSFEWILIENIRKTKDNLYATMIVDTLNQTEEWFDIDVPTFMKYLTDYQYAYNRGYEDGKNSLNEIVKEK